MGFSSRQQGRKNHWFAEYFPHGLHAFARQLLVHLASIIGFLLVEVSTTGGWPSAPTIGMLGFAVALALPFTLFALFPTWLKSAPKGGGWLNCVKVTLGFLELAFASQVLLGRRPRLRLQSPARPRSLPGSLDYYFRPVGYLPARLPQVPPRRSRRTQHLGGPRFFMALVSLAFAVDTVPGLWGAPVKAVSAFAPPISTQDFNLDPVKIEAKFRDYEAGMAYARQTGKPVVVDFTGHGCVNCRKMATRRLARCQGTRPPP